MVPPSAAMKRQERKRLDAQQQQPLREPNFRGYGTCSPLTHGTPCTICRKLNYSSTAAKCCGYCRKPFCASRCEYFNPDGPTRRPCCKMFKCITKCRDMAK